MTNSIYFSILQLRYKSIEFKLGTINFNSSGNNRLINTNNLKTKIVNNLNYQSQDFFTEIEIKNNLNIYKKNINRISKKDSNYKSSPQVEFSSLFEIESSMPFQKNNIYNLEYLIPKISFRYNPTNMNDNSDSNNNISIDNIFGMNRLGLSDTFESGKSITLGIDYKKEKITNPNKFYEIKLASVFRDKMKKTFRYFFK